ncbi:hypothetical protein D1814_16940 [Alteromonas sp. BL110]|uniref:Uncharacterized protein n=1 Tax=Alteromonas portus TaxID=2565549 RepID=A0A4U0ZIL8_9ALTE|nr:MULTISPECIES: hypothetical protein [Alteromonas]AXT40238.1 hypothetical protein D1814_16940 [Alteromonas sp. BL110]RKM79470.1 hypothetical protein D7031_10935 [Alteromonas sp. BL110]TKB03933.1 hypothetical protein E5672_07540 [Alteromonas portus]
MKKLLKNTSLISIAIFACYASTNANADTVSKLTCALNPSSCSSTLGAGGTGHGGTGGNNGGNTGTKTEITNGVNDEKNNE